MINVKALLYNDSGKGYYRIKQPYSLIDRHYDDIKIQIMLRAPFMGTQAYELVNSCDVLVLQNIHSGHPPGFPDLIKYALSQNKIVIYDVDDIDWAVPRENPAYEEFNKRQIGKYVIECLKLATVVTTTTNRLANEIRAFTNRVVVIPNAIDYDYYYWNLPKKDDGFTRIIWTGGSSHMSDLMLVEGIGRWVLDNFENTKFVLGGYDSRMINDNPNMYLYCDTNENIWWHYKGILLGKDYDKSRVEVLRTRNVDIYPELYKDGDILIAPLIDNRFNCSKSPLKLVEASAYSIPVIASDVGIYHDTINHTVDGFLCRTPMDWKRYLKDLITDVEKRKRMGARLNSNYKKIYDIYVQNENRVNLIRKIIKEREIALAKAEINKNVAEKELN